MVSSRNEPSAVQSILLTPRLSLRGPPSLSPPLGRCSGVLSHPQGILLVRTSVLPGLWDAVSRAANVFVSKAWGREEGKAFPVQLGVASSSNVSKRVLQGFFCLFIWVTWGHAHSHADTDMGL